MKTWEKLLLLVLFVSYLTVCGTSAEEYDINPQKKTHICKGWGTSLCWWASECGKNNKEQLEEIIDWLVSPENLNYSVFRYNIGGGDDPEWRNCTPHHFASMRGKGKRAEMDGFKDSADDDYNWSRDEGQRNVMLLIQCKRPDAVFEAFSNSPPYWMTVSGCSAGANPGSEDNISPEMYESFARYLVDVCLHYKNVYGIEFSTLEPFNEATAAWWHQNGGQEGCHFDFESQAAFVHVLYPILRESGLSTVISASDESFVEASIEGLLTFDKANVLPYVEQWNTHTYGGSVESKARLRHLCDSLGIRLWQSETGESGEGLTGNLNMAQRIVDDIRYLQPEVWCDWQYIETNNDQWCLLRGERNWNNCIRLPNYYVRYHFSHFIPNGYIWLDIDDIHGLAAVSPDGNKLVYVTVNASDTVRNVTLHLPETARLQFLYRTTEAENCLEQNCTGNSFALPPTSIITAVFIL